MRAAVFAAACVLVSAAWHGLAGGGLVRFDVLLGALALAWTGAYVLGRRQRGMEVLLAACFASQYGMHHLFSAGAVTPIPPSQEHGSGVGMLLVHVMTALLSAWWLERGESALAALLHLAGTTIRRWWRALSVLAGGLVEPHLHTLRPSTDERVPCLHSWCATAISRRGPPLRFSLI
ncbi:hypothetical protein ETD86_50630 [Nonomuraea turkmeniaca]|uniref:Uncharacterized protein n=1 Tax=Nonomuraea turkmeniaca TaxID=103838 RepID=A0A5S4EW19_9ACTN|nr:hypothetical protein [Nonomuraea turkmeniaca]TMR07762.1 hypothetical protein ETD86_50630 [Nonomuraea turkmeniaca]